MFDKTDSERIALGLEMFSEPEYNNFIGLVKSDLVARGIEVGDVKDGYLTVKVNGNDLVLGLVNLAQSCKLAEPAEYLQIIKEHFDTLEKTSSEEGNIQNHITDFNTVKALLAVQLYPDDYLNAAAEWRTEILTRSSIPTINSTLVFDLPSSIRAVKDTEVQAWNKSEDELFALALNNTVDKIKPEIIKQQLSGGTVTFITSENPLTAVLVLDLKKFDECLGAHGSLVAIPTRNLIMCYPINDLGVIKAISSYMPFVSGLYAEGPGSLSPKLYWYQNGTFTDLPYSLENEKLNFTPPQNFINLLNKLEEPNN